MTNGTESVGTTNAGAGTETRTGIGGLSSVHRPRRATLRVLDLLATNVQSVRFELIGPDNRSVARLGSILVYGPLVAVGYLLLVMGLMRAVAMAVGWGFTCVMFGAAHLAAGVWGIRRGRGLGAVTRSAVLDLAVEAQPAKGPKAADGTEDASTNRSRLPPSFRQRPGMNGWAEAPMATAAVATRLP